MYIYYADKDNVFCSSEYKKILLFHYLYGCVGIYIRISCVFLGRVAIITLPSYDYTPAV